jgi:hypothetical protein
MKELSILGRTISLHLMILSRRKAGINIIREMLFL